MKKLILLVVLSAICIFTSSCSDKAQQPAVTDFEEIQLTAVTETIESSLPAGSASTDPREICKEKLDVSLDSVVSAQAEAVPMEYSYYFKDGVVRSPIQEFNFEGCEPGSVWSDKVPVTVSEDGNVSLFIHGCTWSPAVSMLDIGLLDTETWNFYFITSDSETIDQETVTFSDIQPGTYWVAVRNPDQALKSYGLIRYYPGEPGTNDP